MLELGVFAFTQPWLLAVAAILPGLWWLLRVTPPPPRRTPFPPLRLLRLLQAKEETPSRTPLWLLVLRTVLAALVILALAGPLMNPQKSLAGSGPLLLVVDDGWSSAGAWSDMQAAARRLLEQAARTEREAVIVRTAPDMQGVVVERKAASAAREDVAAWQMHPWPTDRAAAREAIAGLGLTDAAVVWLSDGAADGDAGITAARDMSEVLRNVGDLRVMAPAPSARAVLLRPPVNDGTALVATVDRAVAGTPLDMAVLAVGGGGEVIARAPAAFGADDATVTARLELPVDLRNRIAQLRLEPSSGAGGTVLVDERSKRRSVGLVGVPNSTDAQPLLAEDFFIARALTPYADLHQGSIDDLLKTPLSLMILPDTGKLEAGARSQLEGWMRNGGVLLRFAGPRLAASDEDFLPVPLRAGDRQLGGALSWSTPLALAPFAPEGPFAGLASTPEVTVSRQVLARPGPDLAAATLVSLTDGTPLVTGRRIGDGWLILVHTTANTAWSTLPLSGLFVDMLRRIVALAPGVGGRASGPLAAQLVLDGQGTLVPAPAGLPTLDAATLAEWRPGPAHPPGIYAPPGSVADTLGTDGIALNLAQGVTTVRAFDTASLGTAVEPFASEPELDLAPWLLLVATLLALVDTLASLELRGLLGRWRQAATASAVALLFIAAPHWARADDAAILETVGKTRLAYVVTGNAEVDQISEAGLRGLGAVLTERTAVETDTPVAVDIENDDLAVFPLLYWPIPPEHAALSQGARERVDLYLRGGGMILFDTRDAIGLLPGEEGRGAGARRLGELLSGIDLPPLMQVPVDHALTRSFYLLQDFPGRWTGQPVWVDRAAPGVNDGVSGIIVGANDWAGAWAEDADGLPLLPVVPGGEFQREMARRFGVNVVMYALTGNYKTDQVHVPALLERLGQ